MSRSMQGLDTGVAVGNLAWARSPGRMTLLACLGLVLALKAVWLWGDPNLRTFMGDSGSYLHTAITGWIPNDRSFLYGWFVRWTGLWPQSALALVMAQTAMGVASACLLAWTLVTILSVRPWLALTAAMLLALQPSQLLYERMLMAESAAHLAFASQLCCLLRYAKTGDWRWLIGGSIMGILAVALRISFLPVVLGLALVAPMTVALHAPDWTAATRRFSSHLGLSLLATLVLHGGYMQAYGRLAPARADYLASVGMLRVGLAAPLIKPEHFEGTSTPGTILKEVRLPLADPRNREGHVWSDDGLYRTLERKVTDPEDVARTVTRRALAEDPLGLLRMGWSNLRDFHDPGIREYRLLDDIGRLRPPSIGMIRDLRRHLGYDATGISESDGWSTRWYQSGADLLLAALWLLLPSGLLAALARGRGADGAPFLLLGAVSAGLFASVLLFSHVPAFRYLHPLPWLVLANLAVLADWLLRISRPRMLAGQR